MSFVLVIQIPVDTIRDPEDDEVPRPYIVICSSGSGGWVWRLGVLNRALMLNPQTIRQSNERGSVSMEAKMHLAKSTMRLDSLGGSRWWVVPFWFCDLQIPVDTIREPEDDENPRPHIVICSSGSCGLVWRFGVLNLAFMLNPQTIRQSNERGLVPWRRRCTWQ